MRWKSAGIWAVIVAALVVMYLLFPWEKFLEMLLVLTPLATITYIFRKKRRK
ncbi:MAG: hypothetical protein RR336_10935 [Oscillospiraceae bacterium]